MIPHYSSFEHGPAELEPRDRWVEHAERVNGTRPKKTVTTAIDGHKQFLRWIGQEPPLTGLETVALAERIRTSGEEARVKAIHDLVKANLGLLTSPARKLQPWLRYSSLEIDDLIQSGVFALYNAAEHFDPTKDRAFSTYAVRCILNGMMKTFQDDARVIRIPAATLERISRLQTGYAQERAGGATHAQAATAIAKRERIDPREVHWYLTLGDIQQSLNAEAGNETNYLDQLEDGEAIGHIPEPGPAEQAETNVLVEQMWDALTDPSVRITPREAMIVDMRYGLTPEDREGLLPSLEQDNQEIADQFGLSRERIRQLLVKVHTALNAALETVPPEPSGPEIDEPVAVLGDDRVVTLVARSSTGPGHPAGSAPRLPIHQEMGPPLTDLPSHEWTIRAEPAPPAEVTTAS